MQNLNFLIKPASGLCNMRCRYCFYEDEAANRKQPSAGIMTKETANILIQSALHPANRCRAVSFVFQGGEPTLAGLEYFRYFVERVEHQNKGNREIFWSIQTNGININERWAEFFAKHSFLVGISLDGDRKNHEAFRPDITGHSTWERILASIALLQRWNVNTNLLCVVTKECAQHPLQIYEALKRTGIRYLQFIPCLDPIKEARGSMDWSLSPSDYADFLCKLFDLWYQDWQSGQYVSIRLFDDYVHLAMSLPASTCTADGSCGGYYVVEADGSLYPCDFFCLDQWKLGTLKNNPLQELLTSEKAQEFLEESRHRPAECSACPWKRLCNGGCKRDWVYDDSGSHNYYCSAFQKFFEYSVPRIVRIVQTEIQLQRQQNA